MYRLARIDFPARRTGSSSTFTSAVHEVRDDFCVRLTLEEVALLLELDVVVDYGDLAARDDWELRASHISSSCPSPRVLVRWRGAGNS